MGPNILEEEQTTDYKDLYIPVLRHKFAIIFFAIFCTIAASLILKLVPNVYKADTSIFIETKESNIVSIEGVYRVDMSEQEYFNTQISMLKSRSIAEKVYDKLEYDLITEEKNNKYFISNVAAFLPESIKNKIKQFIKKNKKIKTTNLALEKQEIISELIERLKVTQIESSKLINISFKSQSPELVVKVPNAFARAYIQNGLDLKLYEHKRALNLLNERVTSLKIKMVESENKVIQFKRENNLLDIGGVTTFEAKNLEVISAKLLDARKLRSEIEIIYSQIQQLGKPSIRNYESIPWIMEKSAVQVAKQHSLSQLSKVIELSKLYGEKHPKLQSALSQYKKSRINYAKTLSDSAIGIRNKYLAASSNEQALKNDLANIKQNIGVISDKGYQLEILENEVLANRRVFDTFSNRFKETNQTAEMDSATATIVDKAIIPNKPASPKRKVYTILIFLVSFGFAILVAFVSETIVKTFRFPEDIDKVLGISLLGIIPKLKVKKSDKPFLPFLEDKKSLYAESIRTIRTGIMLSLMKQERKIVIISSSLPSEGKTTVSLNLAIAMGQTQKVLLIDSDMRKSSVAKRCGIDTHLGLSTVLTNQSELDESIHRFEEWSIDILPGGEISSQPQELLCSDKFSETLDTLNQQYDFIIIDSAPIAPVADTLLLAEFIKNIIFVVKADETTHAMATSCLDKLESIDTNIIGIIMNQLDVKKASKYKTDDYYGGYYNDYGYNN